MMDISLLLALARQRSGLGTNNKVAHAVGARSAQMTQYERGHYLPTDKVLIKLCDLAREAPEPWLLQARVLREEGEAKALWQGIMKAYEAGKNNASKAA